MIPAQRVAVQFWHTWRSRSTNRRIFADLLTVGTFTSAVKVVGALKVVITAHLFGTSDALDAFLIAFVMPSFIADMVAGSLNGALIPTFIETREKAGRAAAERVYLSVLAGGAAALLGFALLLAIGSPLILPLFGSGFDAGKLHLTRSLFFCMLPLLPLASLTVTWRAVLNAEERFALAAAAPAVTPTLLIVLLVTLGSRWGIYSLVAGTVCGSMIEATILATSLRRRGYRILRVGTRPTRLCARFSPNTCRCWLERLSWAARRWWIRRWPRCSGRAASRP